MAEIELKKRVVYAGDVHIALLKAGWSIREACERLDGLICDLFNREPISRECIVDYLIQHGVTFREG